MPWPGNRSRASRKSSRSEEHTSEHQSRLHLVCRLLLEKKHFAAQSLPHTPALARCAPKGLLVPKLGADLHRDRFAQVGSLEPAEPGTRRLARARASDSH